MHSSLDFSFHFFNLSVPFSDFSFIVLTLCYKQEWAMYLFIFLPNVKPLHIFCFVLFLSSSNIIALLCPFISFLFPLASCGRSGPSLHILIFPCTSGRSEFFSVVAFFYGLPFLVFCWSFLDPFPYCWYPRLL